jgi:hypothetical protein
LFRSTRLARLLGFQDKAVTFVEIDPAEPFGPVGGLASDGAFEDVVVLFGCCGGRGRAADTKNVAKLGQEQRVVGTFLPALLTLPARDEGFDRGGYAGHFG